MSALLGRISLLNIDNQVLISTVEYVAPTSPRLQRGLECLQSNKAII